jgi:NAD(P)H dehydrogenase (quinone)
MTTLIVTAHPDTDSLTHHVARHLSGLLGEKEPAVAHLAQEGFDPRFTLEDRRLYRGAGHHDTSITLEQQRIDGATDLVLIFPVYWWSMPALLKGWIDRIFIAGWAFDDTDGRIRPGLQHLTMHLLPISGTSEESFARHGYRTSFTTQIEHGIIGYCGMRQGVTAFIHDSETMDVEATEQAVLTATRRIADAIPDSVQGQVGRPAEGSYFDSGRTAGGAARAASPGRSHE